MLMAIAFALELLSLFNDSLPFDVSTRPKEAIAATRYAPDHVIKYEETRPSAYAITVEVRQHGPLLRKTMSQFSHTAVYSDLSRGWSIWMKEGEDGGLEELSAERPSARSEVQALRLAFPTLEQDKVLGEPCRIWRVTGRPDLRMPTSFCRTPDGIVLWERTGSYDRPDSEFRAIRLQRGVVRSEDVVPPREAFEMDQWRTRAEAVSKALGDAEPPNFSLQIQSARCPAVHIRSSYGWTKLASSCSEDVQYVSHRLRAILEIGRTGQPYRVELRLTPSGKGNFTSYQRLDAGEPDWPLATPPRLEFVLGELCLWFEMPFAHDAEASECRAWDGLVLIGRSWSSFGGGDTGIMAIGLQRGGVPREATLPPDDLVEFLRPPDR